MSMWRCNMFNASEWGLSDWGLFAPGRRSLWSGTGPSCIEHWSGQSTSSGEISAKPRVNPNSGECIQCQRPQLPCTTISLTSKQSWFGITFFHILSFCIANKIVNAWLSPLGLSHCAQWSAPRRPPHSVRGLPAESIQPWQHLWDRNEHLPWCWNSQCQADISNPWMGPTSPALEVDWKCLWMIISRSGNVVVGAVHPNKSY